MEENYNQYWLYYNESTGQFKINEVGKTITSMPDDADFKKVGGSNSLGFLISFCQVLAIMSPLSIAQIESGSKFSYNQCRDFFATSKSNIVFNIYPRNL